MSLYKISLQIVDKNSNGTYPSNSKNPRVFKNPQCLKRESHFHNKEN